MPTQFAELVLAARTESLKRGERDLDSLRASGARAERGVTGSMAKMNKGFDRAAAAAKGVALAAGAAVGALAGLGQAVGVIRQFESSMSQVSAITGATGYELEQLRDAAKELGATTEFSAAQAADGLKFLGMAGFEAKEAIQAIPAVLNLATAAAMDLGQSADIASNVLSGFGLAAAQAADVADVLAAASSRSNTSVSQLGGAMSTVAPIAAALDISLQDTAAAIGVLSDAGIQGERAGTALRGALAALAGPTTQAREALAAYGLTAAQVNPEAHSLSEIFGLLQERGLSTADAMEIFGREAASGALVLAGASDRVAEFGDELRGAEGAAADMAATMRDNIGGDANAAASAIQALALAIGEAGLTAVIRAGLQAAAAFARALTQIVETTTQMRSAMSNFFADVTGLAGTQRVLERSIDNASLAMGDQIEQAQRLAQVQGQANAVSLESARVRLAEAKAARELIEAQRGLAEQEFFEASGLNDYLIQAERIRDEMDNIATATARAKEQGIQLTGEMADAASRAALMEQTHQRLVAVMQRIEDIRNAAKGTNFLSEEDAQRAAELEQAIADIAQGIARSRNGMVMLNGEWVQAVDLSGRLPANLSSAAGAASSAAGSASALANNIGIAARAAAVLISNLGMAPAALAGLAGEVDSMVASMERQNTALTYQLEQGLSSSAASIKATRDEAIALAAANGATIDQLAALGTSFDQQAARAENLSSSIETNTDRLAAMADAAAGSGGSGGAAGAAKEAAAASEELSKSLSGNLTGAIDGVSNAFFDFLESGFTNFQDFASGILKSFWNMLKSMISAAWKNRIMFQIGIGGATGGAAAANPLGGIGSTVMQGATGGKGILGGLLGSFGSASAAGSGLLGGLGSTISAIGTSGLGALFTPGANVAAAVSSGALAAGGAMASLGAALPIIGAVGAALFGLFKWIGAMKKTFKEVSEAVELTGHNLDEVAGLGWSAASNLKKLAGGIDELNQLTQSFFDNFYSDAEKIARSQGEVRDVFRDLDRAVPASTEAFKDLVEAQDLGTKEGREAYIQLLEVADAFKQVQDAADQLAANVRNIVDAVELLRPIGSGQFMLEEFTRLAETDFGSVDNFASAISNAYSVLTTDARKLSDAQSLLAETFGDLGLSIPGTREGFLKLLSAQNLMSESGQETFSTLIGVVGAFDQVTPRMADFTDQLAKLNNELSTGLQSAITAAGNAADQFVDLFRDLRDAAADIRAGAAGPGAQAANAMDDFRRSYSLAIGGDIDAMKSIGSLGSKAVESAAALATNATEYRLFASRIANQVENVGDLAAGLGVMKTIEEQTLEEILKLVQSGELTTDLLDESIARLSTMNNSFITSLAGTSGDIVDSLGGVGSGIITELGGLGGELVQTLSTLNTETVLALYDLNEGFRASIQNADSPVVEAIWGSTTDVVSALHSVLAAVNKVQTQDQIAQLMDNAAKLQNRIQNFDIPGKVSLTGSVAHDYIGQAVFSDGGQVMVHPGFTPAQRSEAKIQKMLDAEINKYLDTVNAGRVAAFQERSSLMDQLDALRSQIVSLGGVPGFARGGLHMGGARIVGERGPELEVTGPSRIYSNAQTRSMFDMNGLIAEVRELRRQMAEADDTKINGLARISKNTKDTKDTLSDWDAGGLPAERTA